MRPGEDYASCSEIPDPCHSILTGCGEKLSVPIERNTMYLAGHGKGLHALPGDRIPHDGRPIFAARGETESVRAKVDVPNGA